MPHDGLIDVEHAVYATWERDGRIQLQLFLLAKATYEIHENPEGAASFRAIIAQIVLLDVVFSLDSVIAAVMIAVGVMLVASGPVSGFVDRHPTVKMLALSFLLLIGMSLVAEGLDQHIPIGYLYFAMGFAVFVEALNLRMRSRPRAGRPAPPGGPAR